MTEKMKKVQKIFMDILEISEKDIELLEKAVFKETEQWDSLAHFSLITELEKAFEIRFSEEELLEFTSYKKGIEILKDRGAL